MDKQKQIERFTRSESTYYERAIKRLQELEDKIESGELVVYNDVIDHLRTRMIW